MERRLLLALKDSDKSFKHLAVKGLNEAAISRAAHWLLTRGYIRLEESRERVIRLGPEGERFIEAGMLERILVDTLSSRTKLLLSEAQAASGLSQSDMSLAIGWTRRK